MTSPKTEKNKDLLLSEKRINESLDPVELQQEAEAIKEANIQLSVNEKVVEIK